MDHGEPSLLESKAPCLVKAIREVVATGRERMATAVAVAKGLARLRKAITAKAAVAQAAAVRDTKAGQSGRRVECSAAEAVGEPRVLVTRVEAAKAAKMVEAAKEEAMVVVGKEAVETVVATVAEWVEAAEG